MGRMRPREGGRAWRGLAQHVASGAGGGLLCGDTAKSVRDSHLITGCSTLLIFAIVYAHAFKSDEVYFRRGIAAGGSGR